MKKSIQILFVVITILVVGQSCSNSSVTPTSSTNTNTNTNTNNLPTNTALDCTKVPSAFNANVKQIFATNCAIPTCHNAGSSQAGFTFETYDQIKSGSGSALSSIKSGSMPRGRTLTASERTAIVNTIQCWVNGGSLNN